MSVYSTTLEVIINNTCVDRNDTVKNRILSACNYIFDFDYKLPCVDYIAKDFKRYFEYCFCLKYFNYEIEQETVARFKMALECQLLLTIPKYNIIFETLNKINFDDILSTSQEKEKTENKSIAENTSVGENKSLVENTSTDINKATSKNENKTGSKSASSNLPNNFIANGVIGDFTKVNYADNSSISREDQEQTSENNSTNNNNSTSNNNSSTNNKSTIKNNSTMEKARTSRNMSQIEMVKLYDENFSNYFENFLNEFKILFTDMLY